MKRVRRIGLAFLLALLARGGWAAEMFGHRAYAEGPVETLADAGRYRDTGRMVRLRQPAAEAFLKMVDVAKREGVNLVPISGFRPVSYQKQLFDRAVKRYGSEQKAARWVAPPGYSEHATGWTLDIGDATDRGADVDPKFKTTSAGRWLSRHAARYGFELSFPPQNPQGVNHEPWHWRFVGTDEARATFHPGTPKKIK